MLASDRDNMLCPVAGTTCPGISNCAPAVFRAVQENDDRLVCPIVSFLQDVSLIAMYHANILAELHVSKEVDAVEDKTIHLTPEEAERMRVLQKLGVTENVGI